MRSLILLVLAALAAAVPGDYPAPVAPAYTGGEHKEGYGDGYGDHKFYAPSLGDRIKADIHHAGEVIEHGAHAVGSAIEHGAHAVGEFFKDKWLTLKSDVERILYWGHCKTEKFKKYWKLREEYEAGRRRELAKLEREKLEFFNKWVIEHHDEYERRKHECGDKNDYSYDSDPHHH